MSHFNAVLRRQAETEVVAQDPDGETNEHVPLKSSSEMTITEGATRMQRRREQKHASTVRRIAMQSNQNRQPLRELNTVNAFGNKIRDSKHKEESVCHKKKRGYFESKILGVTQSEELK
jgi:hypothetical protein